MPDDRQTCFCGKAGKLHEDIRQINEQEDRQPTTIFRGDPRFERGTPVVSTQWKCEACRGAS